MKRLTHLFYITIFLLISNTLQYECASAQREQSGCSDQKICSYCSNKNCKYCKKENLNECTECFSNNYFFNNDCFKTQPEGTFCDENTKTCAPCALDNCGKCQDEKLSCLRCKSGYYLLTDLSTSLQSCQKLPVAQNAVCRENPLYDNSMECFSCQNKCPTCKENVESCGQCKFNLIQYSKTCSDLSSYDTYCDNKGICSKCANCTNCQDDDCLVCENGFVKSNGKCVSNTVNYPSTFDEKQVKELGESTKKSSQAISQSSTVLSSAQTLVSSSSFGLIISGLTNQKLVYMALIKNNLPVQIYTCLIASLDEIPSQQMRMLNIFSKFIQSDNTEYKPFYNIKFESVKLEYSIIQNCGQGISICLICYFLLGFFYILTEKIIKENIASIFQKLYDKLFSGLIVQYFELVIAIFAVGINAQILEFINDNEIQHKEIKLTMIFILLILIILIYYKLYYFLNFQSVKSLSIHFSEITRDKIQNETIFECKYKRNFMLIHLTVESIILPTIFIQFNFSYIATSVLILFFQLSLLIITIYLKPFYSKLTNCFFIITSLLWVILYIEYLILIIYSSKENITDYATILDKFSWAFIITLQMILFSSPLYMILTLIVQIGSIIKLKLEERKNKNQQISQTVEMVDQNPVLIRNKEFTSTANYYTMKQNFEGQEFKNRVSLSVYRRRRFQWGMLI